MIEDKATEKLKERLKDMGLIVNAGADTAKPAKSVPAGTEKGAPSPKNASDGTSGGWKGSK